MKIHGTQISMPLRSRVCVDNGGLDQPDLRKEQRWSVPRAVPMHGQVENALPSPDPRIAVM
jgi:hypothetical protein